MLSNITVYVVAWLFLGIRERAEGDQQIGPEDATAFRNIVLVRATALSFFSHLPFYRLAF